ncbi:MAG: sulfotransferase family 2 domain-containing protein [Pelagibacterales bacterium]|nr:sulfotransferase family 2 domain-containing protein [Pelagibacterales bacterium]
MLVNHKRKLIFIHIPKNAGSTFRFTKLPDNEKKEWECPFEDINKYHHGTLWEFLQKYSRCRDYKVIAIIRNPYDRALSWYFYYRTPKFRDNWYSKFRAIQIAKGSFLEFVLWYEKYFKITWEMLPQTFFLTYKGNIFLDYRINLDNVEKELYDLWINLGFHPENKISHINKSSETFKVEDMYCDESISIINKWYKEDFKYFNYDYLVKGFKLKDMNKFHNNFYKRPLSADDRGW